LLASTTISIYCEADNVLDRMLSAATATGTVTPAADSLAGCKPAITDNVLRQHSSTSTWMVAAVDWHHPQGSNG
jgi:hypothetical protein